MQASTFTDNLPMPSSFSRTRNTFPSTHSSTFSSSHNYPILVGNTVLNHKNSSYSMKLLVFQKFLLFAFTRVTPLLNTSSLWGHLILRALYFSTSKSIMPLGLGLETSLTHTFLLFLPHHKRKTPICFSHQFFNVSSFCYSQSLTHLTFLLPVPTFFKEKHLLW